MADHYRICYDASTGLFSTIKNPQHPNYPGYVYGTMRAHTDAASALDEYRECVQQRALFESAEKSAASALERTPALEAEAAKLQRLLGAAMAGRQ